MNYSIIPTAAAHGSNVRGLQTTAEYDSATQEWVLNSNTLLGLKWWPGGLGKTSTHAALYAQLVIHGREFGFHVFVVQLRDHKSVHESFFCVPVGTALVEMPG